MKNNWSVKKLGEVADILMGQSPPSSTYNSIGQGLPFFQGKAEFASLHPKVNKFCSKPVRIAVDGDILLSVRAPVGPINIAQEKTCIGRGLSAIRAKDGLASQWYLYYLLKQHEKNWIGLTGSTFQAINKTIIENLKIPSPNLNIQKKIVERLDAIRKAQEFCDQQIQKTEELYNSIFISEFNTRLSSWPKVRLGEQVVFTQLGLIKSKQQQLDSGVAYLKMDSIQVNGELNLKKAVFVNADRKEIDSFKLKTGDFLFNTRNTPELVGKSAVFLDEGLYLFNNNILRLRFNNLLPVFVNAYFHSEEGKKQLNLRKKGTTSVSAIYQGSLFTVDVPTPTMSDQQKIIEKLEAVQKYKKLLQKQKELLKELFDSVLDKSIKGELDS